MSWIVNRTYERLLLRHYSNEKVITLLTPFLPMNGVAEAVKELNKTQDVLKEMMEEIRKG